MLSGISRDRKMMTMPGSKTTLIGLSNGLSNPWDVREALYPTEGTNKDRLRFLLHYAVLAPSIHNTQPWLFRVSNNEVVLIADRSRALPVVDPDDRSLIMSCGAALMNLRIAMRWFEFDPVVRTFPELTEPDILAAVRVRKGVPPSDDLTGLFRSIKRRRTVRKLFEIRDFPTDRFLDLENEATLEGAQLTTVTRIDLRREIATIVAEADRRQRENKSFRRELASWIHPNRSRSKDGLPRSRTTVQEALSEPGPLTIRTFDRGDGRAAQEEQLVSGSPVFAVLTTEADRLSDWLAAGQALERILLRGTAMGLSFSFLGQPIEMPTFRKQIANVIKSKKRPQAILRVGFARRTRPSPRRPLSDVLVHPGYTP